MPKSYKHLSRDERVLLAEYKKQGLSIREIARRLDRDPSTLSRELRRNADQGYLASRAQKKAEQRWQDCHRRPRLKSSDLRAFVRRKLKQGWSPEQIAGRLRHEKREGRVSHEAIYQWVYNEARELYPCLARAHRKRLSRRFRKHSRSTIPGRVSIRERPAEIGTRQQAGHWEIDTIHSRTPGAVLLIATERKTRYLRLRKLMVRRARGLCRVLIQALGAYPPKMRRTLTYDNGHENLEHLKINIALGTRSFFCDPYQSWQKGTVENSIGLIRRYFPKTVDFAELSEKEIKWVERRLNDRPRKCLNYQTPKEAFKAECCT